MTEAVTPASLPAAWRGIAEWTCTDGWWEPWRLPARELATCASAELTDRARLPNGGRLALFTDAVALEFDTAGDSRRDGRLDVVVDGAAHSSHPVPARPSTVRVDLGPGSKSVEVWLPHASHVRLGAVRVHGAGVLEPTQRKAVRWVAYGSSITQCSGAPGPTRTWPALVSLALDWDLTALGMAGECHLDPAVARTIAATEADLVFLCLGVNIHGKASFSARSLPSAVTGFLTTIRAAHPTTPMVVLTPIVAAAREHQENAVGLTLSGVRQLVAQAVTTMTDLGDDALHLLDGPTILSAAEQHLLADGLHPTPAGYEHLAERLTVALRSVIA